ncbi:MAG: hypothetical protein KKF46_06190 [Nanoarchaeota archaeon]|nr:hypothetical protein [Nanoarchaeota archaeon]MBU1321921.1 hypothetical protein [Nanoarchaeota archaeon]MBU1597614.1 hypothetical protein [Nanoarchaeota archaeon]MBU2440982.1 hypothetical protein [Nanoarchaeota archaeon]
MVKVIAHRGFSGRYPENTLLAIKKAVELGVDWVEIDVWSTIDHCIVLMHDPTLSRTTNGKGRIFWRTFEDIKKFRTKKANQPISLLEEVFPLLKKGTQLNIEIKTVWAAKHVADLIKKHKVQKKVLVSSSQLAALKHVKNELPSLRIAYIYFTATNIRWAFFITSVSKLFFKFTQFLVLALAKSVNANNVHISYPFATKGFIKKLHKKGYKVNAWPINTRALMKKVIRNGADGIITDYPDRLKQVIKEIKKKNKRK